MTFDSIYEMTTPLTEVRKQRMVEEFNGDDIDSFRWTFSRSAGGTSDSPSVMADELDGGFKWTTHNSNTTYYGSMNTGAKYAFDAGSSGFIASHRMNDNDAGTEDYYFYVGLDEDSYFQFHGHTNNTYFKLSVRNNLIGTATTDTTTPRDSMWHTFKAVTNGTRVIGTVDGVVNSTMTYPIPSSGAGDLRPNWQVANQGGTSKTASIRYFEAWNI